MKQFKKVSALFVALALIVSLVPAGIFSIQSSATAPAKDDGKIYLHAVKENADAKLKVKWDGKLNFNPKTVQLADGVLLGAAWNDNYLYLDITTDEVYDIRVNGGTITAVNYESGSYTDTPGEEEFRVRLDARIPTLEPGVNEVTVQLTEEAEAQTVYLIFDNNVYSAYELTVTGSLAALVEGNPYAADIKGTKAENSYVTAKNSALVPSLDTPVIVEMDIDINALIGTYDLTQNVNAHIRYVTMGAGVQVMDELVALNSSNVPTEAFLFGFSKDKVSGNLYFQSAVSTGVGSFTSSDVLISETVDGLYHVRVEYTYAPDANGELSHDSVVSAKYFINGQLIDEQDDVRVSKTGKAMAGSVKGVRLYSSKAQNDYTVSNISVSYNNPAAVEEQSATVAAAYCAKNGHEAPEGTACNAQGECVRCGELVSGTHQWTDATCEAPKTCSACGATEGDVADHDWIDATCNAPKTCADCGATEGEPTGEHNYAEEVSRTESTCITKGSVTTKCACGAEQVTELELNPENHAGEPTLEGYLAPTCAVDGFSGNKVCGCGEIVEEGEVIPATGEHVYATEVSRTDATCVAEGSVTMACGCGAEQTTTLEKDPENHVGEPTLEGYLAPTCAVDGFSGNKVCGCGEIVEEGEVIPATGEHVYATEVSRTDATCVAEGSVTMACGCGAEQTTTLEKDPENHVGEPTLEGYLAPTCAVDGFSGNKVCGCGEIVEEGDVIPATGEHVYATEVSRTDATCVAEGSVTMACGCGAQTTETLPINPEAHTGNNTVVGQKDATCAENGFTGNTVCECGAIIAEGEVIEATGNHNYVDGACDVCGKADPDSVTVEIQGPADQEAAIGETVTFSVVVNSDDATYQWYFRAAGAAEWHASALPGFDTDTLSVEVKDYRDGLQLMCVVTVGGKSFDSEIATLTVESGEIVVNSQPVDVNDAVLGKTSQFTVNAATLGGENISYQWYVYNVSKGEWERSYLEGYNTATLTVSVTRFRVGLQYKCVITSGLNEVETDVVTLNMQQIVIEEQNAQFADKIGGDAVLSVNATGNDLEYQWYFSNDGETWKVSGLTGNKTNELTVKTLAYRVGQIYRCKITDVNGQVSWSEAVTLTVG